MKMIKQIGLLCLLVIVSMVTISCRTTSPEDDDMARVEKILEQLREVDSSAALYSTSKYYQIVYSNDTGDKINFYNIKTEYYGEIKEIDGIHTDAISSVINPILAEDSRELKIQDKDAIIYTYNGREYLCWTISPEDSCVIEYEPGKFDENEIIKMAESVKSSKED